jgi:hypothetical protein
MYDFVDVAWVSQQNPSGLMPRRSSAFCTLDAKSRGGPLSMFRPPTLIGSFSSLRRPRALPWLRSVGAGEIWVRSEAGDNR